MITFQYFDGCPNAEKTLKNLKEVLIEKQINSELSIVEIKEVSEAERYNFQGSPTILVNNKDIYTEKIPNSYNYTCRVYTIDGKQTGILPKAYITDQLSKTLTEKGE